MTTGQTQPPEKLGEATGSAAYETWKKLNPILRGTVDWESYEIGWHAAMRSIWDRLPAPEYARDPMTPREVGRLLDYVRGNLPSNKH